MSKRFSQPKSLLHVASQATTVAQIFASHVVAVQLTTFCGFMYNLLLTSYLCTLSVLVLAVVKVCAVQAKSINIIRSLSNMTCYHVQNSFVHAQVPQECPLQVEQLIDLCLATDPADRPTAKQAFDIISSCSSPAATAVLPRVSPAVQQPPETAAPPQAAATAVDTNQQQQQQQQQHQQLQQQQRQPQKELHVLQGTSAQSGHLQVSQLTQPAELLPGDIAHPIQEAAAQHTDSEQQLPPDASVPMQQVTKQPGSDGMQRHLAGLSNQGVDQHAAASTQGYDTSLVLPMGVLGHLYPSPFAVAADASSGPLWDWQTSAAV